MIKLMYDKNHEAFFIRKNGRAQIIFKRLWSNKGSQAGVGDLAYFSNSQMQQRFLEKCGLLAEFEQMDEATFFKKFQTWLENSGYPPQLIEKVGIINLEILSAPSASLYADVKTRIYNQIQQILDQRTGLPMLDFIQAILANPYFKNYYQDILGSTLVVMVQQGFSSVRHNVETLINLGIPSNQLIFITKPHTTCDANRAMFLALAEQKKFHYICTGVDEHSPWNNDARQELVLESIHQIHRVLSNSPHIKNIVYYDEGATLSRSAFFRKTCLEDLRQTHQICMSEHTISGVETRNRYLQEIDVLMMARSWIKTQYEPYLIAESAFQYSQVHLLDLLNHRPGLKIGLIGCGRIGSEFARLLIDFIVQYHQSSKPIELDIHDVIFKDSFPTELHEEALSKNVHVNFKYSFLERQLLFQQADIVFGATGHDISCDLPEISNAREIPTYLASLSSGTREFQTVCEQPLKEGEDLIFRGYHLKLLNMGHPMNFQTGQPDAVDPQKIQLIRALSVATVFLQIIHIKISLDSKAAQNNEPANHCIRIDGFIQNMLWCGFKEYYHRSGLIQLPYRIINRSPKLREMKTYSLNQKDENPLVLEHHLAHAKNKIQDGDFDKNHESHFIIRDGIILLAFLKDKQLVIDFDMVDKLCQKINFDIKKFYFYHPFEQIMQLQELFSLYSIRASEEQCLNFFEQFLDFLKPHELEENPRSIQNL